MKDSLPPILVYFSFHFLFIPWHANLIKQPKISRNNYAGKPTPFSSMSIVGQCGTTAGFI